MGYRRDFEAKDDDGAQKIASDQQLQQDKYELDEGRKILQKRCRPMQ